MSVGVALAVHDGAQVLRAGQLVLMDAGCELHGHCSDVTRTWPVGGRYTPAQRAVYQLVLSVHARCALRTLRALCIPCFRTPCAVRVALWFVSDDHDRGRAWVPKRASRRAPPARVSLIE